MVVDNIPTQGSGRHATSAHGSGDCGRCGFEWGQFLNVVNKSWEETGKRRRQCVEACLSSHFPSQSTTTLSRASLEREVLGRRWRLGEERISITCLLICSEVGQLGKGSRERLVDGRNSIVCVKNVCYERFWRKPHCRDRSKDNESEPITNVFCSRTYWRRSSASATESCIAVEGGWWFARPGMPLYPVLVQR